MKIKTFNFCIGSAGQYKVYTNKEIDQILNDFFEAEGIVDETLIQFKTEYVQGDNACFMMIYVLYELTDEPKSKNGVGFSVGYRRD